MEDALLLLVLCIIAPTHTVVNADSTSSTVTTITTPRGALRGFVSSTGSKVDYLGHKLVDDMEFYAIFLSAVGALVFCSLLLVASFRGCRRTHDEIAPEKPRSKRVASTFSTQQTQYNLEDLNAGNKPMPPKRKIKIRVNKAGQMSLSATRDPLPPLKVSL